MYMNLSNTRRISDLAVNFGSDAIKLKPINGSFGGFANYLSRGNAPCDEDTSKDVVVFSSWDKPPVIECVPSAAKERTALKNKIMKDLDINSKYIGVIYEPDVQDLDKFSEEIELLSYRDIYRLGNILVGAARADYPSFEPVFAVWHIEQLVKGEKKMGKRAPHLHVIMRQARVRRKDKEIERLDRDK